jgi:hypothetical protein
MLTRSLALAAAAALLLMPLGCGNDAPPAVTEQDTTRATPAASSAGQSASAPASGGQASGGQTPGRQAGGATPANGVVENGAAVIANGLRVPVPEGWTAEPVGPTPMNIRIGQMRLAGIDGPEGIMAITGNIGGGVDVNIARWVSQIRDPIGEPVRERIDLGDGLTLHTFRMEGSFHPGAMSPNAPVLAGYLSLGAIVSGGPQGDVFFKLTAPASSLQPHEERWNEMLSSIRRAGPQATP